VSNAFGMRATHSVSPEARIFWLLQNISGRTSRGNTKFVARLARMHAKTETIVCGGECAEEGTKTYRTEEAQEERKGRKERQLLLHLPSRPRMLSDVLFFFPFLFFFFCEDR